MATSAVSTKLDSMNSPELPTATRAEPVEVLNAQSAIFTLWQVPRKVLGVALPRESAHEAFNRLVLERTGLIGVHFPGPFIRYAVCADVLAPEFRERFERGMSQLQPQY